MRCIGSPKCVQYRNCVPDARLQATKVDPALNGQDVHGDHTVSSVPFALRMLADHQLFDELDIEMDCMKRYLRRVERDYKRNPYHNRVQ